MCCSPARATRLILVGTLKNRPLITWRWKGNNALHPKNALDIVTSGIYELGGEPQWHEPGAVPPESRASETLAPRQLREALLQAREAPADEKLVAALAWRYPYAEAAGSAAQAHNYGPGARNRRPRGAPGIG